jgi:hypothetical protein
VRAVAHALVTVGIAAGGFSRFVAEMAALGGMG